MFAVLLLAVPSSCPFPQGPQPEHGFGFPPLFEVVRGASAVGPLNVGKNLRLNRDNTSRWQNEYSVAVNPTDPDNLLASANDYRSGQPVLGHYASLDGGKTVVSDGILPLVGWLNSGDPAVGFDGFGNGYIVGLHFNRRPLTGALYVHKTTDGGRTFQAPVRAFFVSGNLPDKPMLAIDQRTKGSFAGSLYITFTGFFRSPVGLQVIHSRDGGRTWSKPVGIGTGQGTSPAVGPDGQLYVAWQSGNSIQFNASTNGGVSFSGARVIASITRNPSPLPGTRFRCNSFPTVAVDRSNGPYRGRIHVCWSSRSGGSSEIFAIHSSDGGRTWSKPVRVNDVARGDQYFQWLAVDEAGTVFASWHDRRDDPANRAHACYASASYDGGRTWVKNWKVSETVNDPGNTGFLGDYNGLDARAGRAFPTWVDLRRGNQDAYTAPLQTDLEFSPPTLSAAAGGTVALPIKAGPARAGQSYFLLANFTGVGPGVRIGEAVFYLNHDPLVDVSFTLANTPPFLHFGGTLGAGGQPAASPRFQAPPGLLAPAVGLDLSFAYLLLDRTTGFTYGSRPVSVRITR